MTLAGYTVRRPVAKRLALSASSGSVVSLAQAKKHLRVSIDYENAYILSLIDTATDVVERFLNRCLLPRVATLTLDAPEGLGPADSYSWWCEYAAGSNSRVIQLLKAPVYGVTSVSAVDDSGAETALPASQWNADFADPDALARVVLRDGASWPSTGRRVGALKVVYQVGYLTVEVIPPGIRHAILLVIAALWSSRGDGADPVGDVAQLPGVQAILAPYRILGVGTL